MPTFEDSWNSLETEEVPSVLLGNGFSQSWRQDIFNYANLLGRADFGAREVELRGLFNRFNTYDFETVMKNLIAATEVLEIYGGDPTLLEQLRLDKEVLKESLIVAIANSHPNLPSDVSDAQYLAVRNFLSRFRSIFTLNYDLLMYWARNKNNLPPTNYTTDDGFRANSTWKGYETNQQVFFLHGGLHIYDTGSFIKKHQCTDDGVSIIEQVRENLNTNKFPIFVSEPTHTKKKSKMEHSPYLSHGLSALRRLTGVLFIHGHSFDENDKHIFDQIKSSSITKVHVSIFGDPNSDGNTRTRANAKAYLEHPGLEVKFYDAATAPVWA